MRPHLLFSHFKSSLEAEREAHQFLCTSLLTGFIALPRFHSLHDGSVYHFWEKVGWTPTSLHFHFSYIFQSQSFPWKRPSWYFPSWKVTNQMSSTCARSWIPCSQAGNHSLGSTDSAAAAGMPQDLARGGKCSKGQPWFPGTNLAQVEQQRQSNPGFCVTSHFWVLKGRKWDCQTNFPFAVHPGLNQSLNIALSNKQVDTNCLSDFSYHGTSLQSPIPLDLLQWGEYWGFQLFPLTLLWVIKQKNRLKPQNMPILTHQALLSFLE